MTCLSTIRVILIAANTSNFTLWIIDNKHIKIGVTGNNVRLTGSVHSLYQKDEAGRLAWNAPGVWSVDNELDVIYN